MKMVMVLLGLFFVSNLQPVFMVGSLILIVLMYSYVMYGLLDGYWYGYVLILVMLSGLMVIFTYMVSFIPNESFENYNLVLMVVLIMSFVGYWVYMYMDNLSYLCLNLWINYMGLWNLFMVGFLFGMMLVVVWLGYMNEGSVRLSY